MSKPEAAAREDNGGGPDVGKSRHGRPLGLTVETTLDPTAQPFLYDHRIDGTQCCPA